MLRLLRPWDRQPQEVVELTPDFPAIAGFVAGDGGTRNVALYPAEPNGIPTGASTYPSPGSGGIGVYSAGSADHGVKLHSVGNATNTVWERPSAQVSVAVFLRRLGNTGGNSPIFGNLHPSVSPFTAWGIDDAGGTGTPRFAVGGGGSFTSVNSSAVFGNNEDVVIVGTYDGANIRIYRNGVLTGTAAETGAISYPNNATRGPAVGNFWGGFTSRSFNGFIYGGLLSDIAWTDAEVGRISTAAGFWSAFKPQTIWVPVSAGGGPTYTLTADGGAYAHTGGTAGLVAGRKIAAAGGSYTHTGGTAGLQAGRKIAADGGAFTHTGGAAGLVAGRKLAADGGAYAFTGGDADLVYTPVSGAYTLTAEGGTFVLTGGSIADVATTRRHAGWRQQTRRGYIIKGKRYWLTEDELMALVAQEITAISRKDVKQITKTKPKVISKQVWDAIKPLERLEALTPIEQVQDDDEEDVLMMFV